MHEVLRDASRNVSHSAFLWPILLSSLIIWFELQCLDSYIEMKDYINNKILAIRFLLEIMLSTSKQHPNHHFYGVTQCKVGFKPTDSLLRKWRISLRLYLLCCVGQHVSYLSTYISQYLHLVRLNSYMQHAQIATHTQALHSECVNAANRRRWLKLWAQPIK